MKIQFNEYGTGTSIELVPETVEDTASLLRFTNNTKAKKPEIYFSFSGKIYCNIWFDKISDLKQLMGIQK